MERERSWITSRKRLYPRMNASTLVVLTQMLSQSMMADVYNLSLNIPKLFGLAAYPFPMFDLTKLMMPEKCPFYGLAWYIMVYHGMLFAGYCNPSFFFRSSQWSCRTRFHWSSAWRPNRVYGAHINVDCMCFWHLCVCVCANIWCYNVFICFVCMYIHI